MRSGAFSDPDHESVPETPAERRAENQAEGQLASSTEGQLANSTESRLANSAESQATGRPGSPAKGRPASRDESQTKGRPGNSPASRVKGRPGSWDESQAMGGAESWGEDADGPVSSELRWRVSPGFTALKCAVTVALMLAAVFLADDRRALSAAVVATVVAGAYALRDLLAPVRLAADPKGITVVSGYAGHNRLAWNEIERIRLESRTRAGLRSEFLEIDTGETLHLLSTYDLNARPADVAEALAKLQAASGTIG